MGDREVRQRKKKGKVTHGSSGSSPVSGSAATHSPAYGQNGPYVSHANSDNRDEKDHGILQQLRWWASVLLGLTAMVVLGFKHAQYMHTIHENDLWFSNIKEVEREISFRTESGLYYAYYKQFLAAPTVTQGLYELTVDNHTEHLNTINILERFNIYQEVLLGVVYRSILPLQGWLEPVYFYINTVFGLHGLLVCSLYVLTWLLSESWLAGALAACFYIFNRIDTTRVAYVIPLRESFALPFLWGQLVFLTVYFSPHKKSFLQYLAVVGTVICTFCLLLFWQFSQFIILLQAFALFGCQILELLPRRKLWVVYFTQLLSLMVVALLQFGNRMLLAGFAHSFIDAAIIVLAIQAYLGSFHGFFKRSLLVVVYVALVFVIAVALNAAFKFIIQPEADEHIYKFVQAKFGVGFSKDFDVRLYLCNGAFTFLDVAFISRTLEGLVLPFYAVAHLVLLVMLAVDFIQRASNSAQPKTGSNENQTSVFSKQPELAFHVILTCFFGAMAITTLRMKYLWTPYMCVIASVGLAHPGVWRTVMKTLDPPEVLVNIVRSGIVLIVLGSLLYKALPPVLKELEELREFYDPDTVELMEWIKDKTPPGAALTGSMQLLAGVKLCTGRPVTNHPHYEDKGLRKRTKELYQMYARKPAVVVHDIMRKYNASYIILEDSICLAPSRDGCRLPDLLDVDNGQIPDSGKKEEGLVQSKIPRFCNEIRYGKPEYKKRFKLVLSNKTFRVYKVIS